MKGVLDLLRRTRPAVDDEKTDSVFFTSAFADQGVDPSMLVPWEARANEVGAKRLQASRGLRLLQALWAKDKYMSRLEIAAVQQLGKYFDFALVEADRDIIRQDEYGNFMIVLLTGTIAVDRMQPWGERLRLTEARPGDILGEMSLLDSGQRFSLCTTLTECEIAVLGVQAMDEMMSVDPQLAAGLVALLARKLSMRLRVVGARLSDRETEAGRT
jgi:CRP/FNR family cyclic AMP-dependent transcriptional regulator